MNSSIRMICTLLLTIGVCGTISSQKQERHWLDNGLQNCKKSKAALYMVMQGEQNGKYQVTLHSMDGSVMMEGASTTADGLTFSGLTTFFHANGQVESKGMYLTGQKVGLWERWDANGNDLSERSYASFDHMHMAYTYVDKMPEFEGGEKKFCDFLKHRISSCVSELRADEKELQVTFVISEKGTIEDMKMHDGEEEIASERLNELIADIPNWQPGQKQGRAVRVLMTMPIRL